MEFKEVLQKLRYSNRFNRSSFSKEIIANIHHVNKTELLNILELLHDTVDMEYQVKLISVLTAYILLNSSCRDVLIKSTFIYEILRKILTRSLPHKTTITLNYITSLLYAEDERGSRSRTLTLHAQNLIRNSGCLTTMIHLFMNYMLYTETWQALCRCLAEVCRGSEPNQNICSHMVPLCVQRCLQGNLDVVPVLQSLLFNHKRNTKLFIETDGACIFNRKETLRLEACLQLLSTVIQNAENEAIRTISGKVRASLQELLKTNTVNTCIVQWTRIISYYLDSKLKDEDTNYNAKKNLNQNTLQTDSNVHDTQTLLQNIMTEILSYPSKSHPRVPFNNKCQVRDKFSNLKHTSRVVEETKFHENISYNLIDKPSLATKIDYDERLSFSFLMGESEVFNQSDRNNQNDHYQKRKAKQSELGTKRFRSVIKNSSENSKLSCESFKTFDVKCDNITDFKPTFVSTPKRKNKMNPIIRHISSKTSLRELHNKSRIINRTTVRKLPKKKQQEYQDIKHKSMSSRIFDAINESCTTVIKSFKNVFAGNKTSQVPQSVKNEDRKSYCSYSFTNFMKRREAGLMESNSNKDGSSEINTGNTLDICNTCDDTLLMQQKFTNDEQLKSTVKKLKLGINLYGCDFKRISKTMWPREAYMTPNVLYNLYRKLILK